MSSIAQRAIDRGLRLAGESGEAFWWLHFNAWRIAIVSGNEAEARRKVERLILHRTPPTFVTWDKRVRTPGSSGLSSQARSRKARLEKCTERLTSDSEGPLP
jgi:hypothetical protein